MMRLNTSVTTQTKRFFLTATMLFVAVFSVGLLTSCSEDKDETDEFANWQEKNTNYWNQLYSETKQKIANGDKSWKIFLNYSMQGQTDPSGQITYKPEDHIIVHELEKGTGTKSPLYTDSVLVHYQGRLIPSQTYTAGLIFDSSFGGANGLVYNPLTSRPAQLLIGGEKGGVVDGFATALQNMHVGDHWLVYIPYQLGYGAKKIEGVPAYSNLIFDLRLHSFYRAGTSVPNIF